MNSLAYAPLYTELAPHLPGQEHGWVRAFRARALAKAEALGLPESREEAWKYMRLKALREAEYAPEETAQSPHVITAQAGMTVTRLQDVFHSGDAAYETLLQEALEHCPHGLEALAYAFATDGWIIDVAAHVTITEPVVIHHATAIGSQSHHSLLLVRAGQRAKVTLLEHVTPHGTGWSNHSTRIHLGQEAECSHVIVQAASPDMTMTQTQQVQVAGQARYRQHLVATGGRMARHELHTHLNAPDAFASMRGAYLGRDNQLLDHYLPVYHHAPRCESEQRYKGVLDDQAQGVFYGKIIVPVGASGTEAHQQSRALLLSPQAEADNRPELEILTDDVICSHGAAIGALDKAALHYLQARGLPETEARQMLVEAFVNEVFEDIASEPTRELVMAHIAQWLAGA